jgi:hypothetical protein
MYTSDLARGRVAYIAHSGKAPIATGCAQVSCDVSL